MSLFLALCWISAVLADSSNNTTSPGISSDPYLPYKPEFARSLPVQTLVTGVVFTLVAVLFVHIVFTGQYHWPLAPVNYALQLSGVVSLLVSLIATIHVICSSAITESEHWPYMLSYIAVNVPPLDMLNVAADPESDGPAELTWSPVERGTWLMMNAAVSALAQITHIHFLTLLFPSRLEARLIFSLLGPLAILAAIMQLIPIQPNTNLIAIANNIRNVCNATLSLLFTASLFIWGLLVNRSQAWRTDGGTAVFGASALTLAMVSTALNFLYVPKNEEYVWLPGLIWAVIFWQSFLGWWWWVGAGSGQSTEDVVEQVFKRGERFADKRRRAKSTKKKKGGRKEAGGEFGVEECSEQEGRSELSDESTMSTTNAEHRRTRTVSSDSARPQAHRTNSNGSSTSEDSMSTLPRFLPRTVHMWYHNLRQAHVTAARKQTVERVERIREIERGRMGIGLGTSRGHTAFRTRFGFGTGTGTGTEGVNLSRGWGLGSFGWRESRRNGAVVEYEMESNPRRRRRGSDESQEQREYVSRSGTMRNGSQVEDGRPSTLWWWRPFSRWRLQDSTVYR
ncbi:hypothetical protein F5878DRAFT_664088 [Lentinula raphanica]|uniref:Uncharacterized protein n=1 Tax=Lentinula raphanica TaxID=153919 RepID=A0AA38UEL1_9AGAR|nr:hypothetical protein F5878DRAFT_664088 [Lentinula raphanica]